MKQLLSLIKKVVRQEQVVTIVSGKVSEVSGDTCTITRDGLADLVGVRLNAVSRSFESQCTILPKVDSDVQCAIIENNSSEAFLVGYSEIESVVTSFGENKTEISADGLVSEQGQTVFKVTSEGVTIERNGKNLLDEIVGVIEETSKIIVAIGTSVNAPALLQHKTNIENILK